MEKIPKRTANVIFAISAILSCTFFPSYSFASIESDPAVPEIISRKAWGADESLMKWPTEYANLEKFIVHHTASTSLVPDTDGSGLYKSMVNAIYKYHAGSKSWTDGDGSSVNGFGDIGYNYVVDPSGNVYEGRYGGNGVVAGHASGFNTGSVGISVIGNYQDGAAGQTNTSLDEKVKKSLSRLIGWIAANNGINLSKISAFHGKSIDGVVGHRDVAATQCPGTVMYSQLDSVQADAILYEKEYQKYLYQIKGSDAIYYISGGYKTKYASKSVLPVLLQTRTIHYISKIQLDAYKYKDITTLPDGSLIQTKDAPTVYYIEDGKKRPMSMSGAEFLKLGFKASDIATISSSDLDLYETGKIIQFGPEGTLIKDARNVVYFIENGRKRIFTSAQLFEYLKYNWANVKADLQADYYFNGSPMVYPSGTLIKTASSSAVYLIENENRRTFTSGALFEKLGYKWGSILTIAASELNSYPLGANMICPNSTLIRGAGAWTVYLVDGGQKREITSATLLVRLGYNFANVMEIPAATLVDYPTGTRMTYPVGTLIKAKNGAAVYRVAASGKEEFTSLNVFNASGAKWANIVEISQDEMNLYSTTGIVKYPDGTLLRASGGEKIYAMKNGVAVWIQTAEEFTKAGYKWANVLIIDPAEMKLYASDSDTSSDGNSGTVSGTEPRMRVAITSSTGDKVSITANGNYKVEYRKSNGDVYQTAQKKSGETTDVAFFTGTDYIRFVPESDNVIMQILSYSDATYSGNNDNRFRGIIELRYSTVSQKLWVVEDVPLEQYLKGISEATTYTNAEYLKAFSIITRTYAMNYIMKGGKYAGEPFYLKNSRNGNGNDQQYKGYNLEIRSPRTANSYDETKGMIIEYKDKPIVAAYSSDSGGVTKDACQVLTKNYCTDDYAYLRGGVKDPDATVHNADKVAASHGAGMSAVGANQMATEGSDWQKIITTYYPGVNIDKYY